jgi:hypothetical protein
MIRILQAAHGAGLPAVEPTPMPLIDSETAPGFLPALAALDLIVEPPGAGRGALLGLQQALSALAAFS